ncbi:hypothetical protein AVEN_233000-1 [Araneus ventricosus]|uniref:Uncharacterized protein n=1 Tax=Araneus ventricosus TaxID=182803 RepID=A0A4Y2RB30_ARAVE|nr:hypothetical protein AVEN_233000-1 [Araneus ventricosus]
MFSLEGEVYGRASPSGTILREPIETQMCSSRYAPAHHGALQGKAVAGSGYFQPRYLPWRWHRDIALQRLQRWPYSSKSLFPKNKPPAD